MFEHLDDPIEPEAGPLELARVLSRAQGKRTRRKWLAAVVLCGVVAVSSIGFALSRPFDQASSIVSNYQFNDAKGPPLLGSAVPTTALLDVQFANEQNGFAFALHRNTVFLAASNDGGSTWTVRNNRLPAGFGPDTGYPGQIEFVGSSGYLWGASTASGAPLWISHDTGATWHRAPIGPYVYDASAIGFSVWALTGTCPLAASSNFPCSATVEQSLDGGTTWFSRGPISPPGPLDGRSLELARISTDRSYVLENAADSGGVASWKLAFTADGGVSWTTRALPCSGPFSLGAEVAASSTEDLWVFCGGQATSGEQSKQLYRSEDGGQTWRLTASATGLGTPPPTSVPPNPLPLSGYISPFTVGHHNLAVASPTTAWLFPSRAVLSETRDGGSSWVPVPDLASASFADGALGDISFLSGSQGWICEYGVGLWHTSDGVTWSPLGAS